MSEFSTKLSAEIKKVRNVRPIVGCTDDEIEEIQSKYNIILPSTYVDFLKVMGKECQRFCAGSDIEYRFLLESMEAAIDLLQEDENEFILPPDAFVFFMHQGYQFMYFICHGNDDPPVFYYYEGKEEIRKIYDSFSKFVFAEIEMLKKIDAGLFRVELPMHPPAPSSIPWKRGRFNFDLMHNFRVGREQTHFRFAPPSVSSVFAAPILALFPTGSGRAFRYGSDW